MDARRPCPDTALLAAYLDHALTGYEREAVIAHLADCPQCRAIAVTVVEFREVAAHDASWDGGQASTPRTPRFVSGVARWSRAKTRAPARALAAAVVLAAIAIPIFLLSRPAPPAVGSSSPQHAVSTLIEVAERQRPVEARLSGAVAYAPPPTVARPVEADAARIRLITTASQIRSAYAHDYGAPSRRAIGVAALVTGDLDEAIATLEVAAAGAPEDVEIANDLAAAYYERAQRADRPDDLPAALSAVESVLHAHPAHLQALFNRALIITALGLRAEAEAAWQTYIARDGASPWTAEARQRASALALVTRRAGWATVRESFEASGRQQDADIAVQHHTTAARDYVENSLWKAYVRVLSRGDQAAADAVARKLRTFATAFSRVAADRLYSDLVAAIDGAVARGGKRRFIAAHEEYFAAMQLVAKQQFGEALPTLRRVQTKLAEVGSPWALRARIEYASALYYSMRYTEARGELRAAKQQARERRHAILLTRVSWLEGMVAFALNDFAASQSAYEDMSASAGAAGDVDPWVMSKVLLASLLDVLGHSDRAWRHRIDAAVRLDDVFSPGARISFLGSAAGDSAAAERHEAALLFQRLMLAAPGGVPLSTEVQFRALKARSLLHLQRSAEAHAELDAARGRLSSIADPDTRLRVEADVLGAELDAVASVDSSRAVAIAERLLELPVVKADHLRRARAHLGGADALLTRGQIDRAETHVHQGLVALAAFQAAATSHAAIRATDAVWRLYSNGARIALQRGDVATAFGYIERWRRRTEPQRADNERTIATLQRVQQSLPRGAAMIMLTPLDDRALIWVIRSTSVATHAAPLSMTRASALIAAHLQEMLTETTTPQMSAELFDALFRPVLPAIRDAERLIIVADPPYNRLAFPGLWDQRRNRYLIEEHRLIRAPNATTLLRLTDAQIRQSPRPESYRAALVGRAIQGAASTRALSASYGPRAVTAKPEITASQFVLEVASGDIVHVVAPVIANPRYPELSQLQLTDEPGLRHSGALFAAIVAQQRLRANLVTFEQGLDEVGQSEGSLALVSALLAGGVGHVVVPVAHLGSQKVDSTWAEFHRQYASGVTASESLRRAQLRALHDSARRPGPWAALTVFGSAE